MPKQRRIERKAAKAAAKAASVLSKSQQVLHSQQAAGCLVWNTPLKEQPSMFFSKLFPGKQQRNDKLKRPKLAYTLDRDPKHNLRYDLRT
jgi:hypothetical protein